MSDQRRGTPPWGRRLKGRAGDVTGVTPAERVAGLPVVRLLVVGPDRAAQAVATHVACVLARPTESATGVSDAAEAPVDVVGQTPRRRLALGGEAPDPLTPRRGSKALGPTPQGPFLSDQN